jgi:hypothetical protein
MSPDDSAAIPPIDPSSTTAGPVRPTAGTDNTLPIDPDSGAAAGPADVVTTSGPVRPTAGSTTAGPVRPTGAASD